MSESNIESVQYCCSLDFVLSNNVGYLPVRREREKSKPKRTRYLYRGIRRDVPQWSLHCVSEKAAASCLYVSLFMSESNIESVQYCCSLDFVLSNNVGYDEMCLSGACIVCPKRQPLTPDG
jgi:hypothetical protein